MTTNVLSPAVASKGNFAHASGARPLPGFTIKHGIGVGGFGEVYFATSDAGKEVALKLIRRNLEVELRGVTQCLNLKHPNLLGLHDVRKDDAGDTWVIMEHMGGESLEQALAKSPKGLGAEAAIKWFEGIAAGVACLHEHGIVHRDLKPANIFFEAGLVKIGDYGLSKFISTSRGGGQTESVGTVHYMAPEIAKGRYGKEVDQYALGVILFEMLTGRPPFDGESVGEVLMKHLVSPPDLKGVAEPFRSVIERSLRKDPEQRFVSAAAMAAALRSGNTATDNQPAFEDRLSKHSHNSCGNWKARRKEGRAARRQAAAEAGAAAWSWAKAKKEKRRAQRERAQAWLADRPTRTKATELCGGMLASAAVIASATVILAMFGGRDLTRMQTLTSMAWFGITGAVGTWGVLAAAKMWGGLRDLDLKKRGALALFGAGLGAASWSLANYLMFVVPHGWRGPRGAIQGLADAAGAPTLAGFVVYFAAMMAIVRWRAVADPLRSRRFRVGPVFLAGLAAWLINIFLHFPQPTGALLAGMMALAVQIASPTVDPSTIDERIAWEDERKFEGMA